MSRLDQLFKNNRAWVASVREEDPQFFSKLAGQQHPEYLWIGCADSRVPANQVTGLMPGEVFVHRNIANVVAHSDLNCLSVIQFAVQVLKIRHIIVCGHYGCGGVRAAYEDQRHGLVDNWLRHVQDVVSKHRTALDQIPDDEGRLNRLSELNVIEQVANVCRTTVLRDAWASGQLVTVHGWIYNITDGLLIDLDLSASSTREVQEMLSRATG
ncbi:MAG: carbonate dehydratase [Gammaproteobacteria bacterium]|nr:carbonate dehydratase [Gammaproteobacteria bacterium]